MVQQLGSQYRETLEEAGFTVAGRIDENAVVLQEVVVEGDGNYELWMKRDDYAGYVVVIDGEGYEFVRTALMGDLWWAGITTPKN